MSTTRKSAKPDYLGLRHWYDNNLTGDHVGVYDARAAGLDDDGGRWVVVCEAHGTVCNFDTLAHARSFARTQGSEHCPTVNFCEDCMRIADESDARENRVELSPVQLANAVDQIVVYCDQLHEGYEMTSVREALSILGFFDDEIEQVVEHVVAGGFTRELIGPHATCLWTPASLRARLLACTWPVDAQHTKETA